MAGIGHVKFGNKPAANVFARYGNIPAIIAVALLYALGGWLGSRTALPPGYATIVWPGSGVALAAVLLHRVQVWPGVLLGSFAINCWIAGVLSGAADWTGVAIALLIAIGASLQALVVTALVRRQFGRPIHLNGARDAITFLLLVAPAGCTISASIGTAALVLFDLVPWYGASANWLTWWIGDTLGVLLILPLALLAPWWGEDPILWRGTGLARLSLASLAVVAVSLILTFYIWESVTGATQARGRQNFDQLADEVTAAFQSRMSRFEHSLAAGAGLVLASDRLNRAEWRSFADQIDLVTATRGLNGLGLIMPVPRGDLAAFVAEAEADGLPGYRAHPQTEAEELFLVKYIEPMERNAAAIGLDLNFEVNRREAASTARDSGQTKLSRPIALVQDERNFAGFVLLRPVYRSGRLPVTIEARRRDMMAWVFAPLTAENLFSGLIPDVLPEPGARKVDPPRPQINLTVREEGGDRVIFTTLSGGNDATAAPLFTREQTVVSFGRSFTFLWESTPELELQTDTNEAAVVLGAGLIISALIASLFVALINREAAAMRLFHAKARALSAQERLNSTIVDTAVVGTASTDAQGRLLRMSRSAAEMFGLAAEQAEGLQIAALFGSRYDEVAELMASPIAARGRRIEVKTPDLGRRVLDVQVSRWTNEENLLRYTWVIADITAQAEAEERLKETEQRLDMALEGAQIGVYEVDLRTGKSVVSRTWKLLMGLDPDAEVDAQAEWRRRIHPEDFEAVRASDRDCIAGRTARSVTEYRMTMPDGSIRWLKSHAIVPERNKNGRALRIIGTQSDVTVLREARAALESSETMLRGMLANAPVGMALVNRDSVLMNVNEALCGFLGQPRDRLLGARLVEFTHPDDVYADGEQLRRLLAGELTSYQCEKRYVRPDDSVVWGLLSVSVAGPRFGQEQAMIAQIQDINELKAVERMKGDFIASVSHELRTPLTSIKGALGIVTGTMKEALPQKVTHLLGIAQKNCDRLIQLVNDILDMERLSSDQTSFSFSEAVLAECVADVVAACQPFAQQFDVQLVAEPLDEGLRARVDVNRLNQVITNLISNAVKYSPRGGTVKVSLEATGGSAVISVTDNGQGIPESFRTKMFRPFSQIDMSSTRKVGGTGLGLNISRQIVDRMGGMIDYVSEPGVATTFSVTLPLSETAVTATPGATGRPQRGRAKSRQPRILHVEANLDFNEVLTAAFGKTATVRQVATAAAARKAIERDRFDLVIIDWELPDGLGEDLLPLIRRAQGIPVVGLSAREISGEDSSVPKSFVKSRATMDRIVADCLEIVAKARLG